MDFPVSRDNNAHPNQVLKENEVRYTNPHLLYSYLLYLPTKFSLLSGGQLQTMFNIRNIIETDDIQHNLTKVSPEKHDSKFSGKICNRSCTNKNALEGHERLHRMKRQFQCPHCDKSFSSSSGIRVHIRKHTGERPHQCPHCDNTFIKRSSLLLHIRKHTGERPYKCDYCDKTFTHLGDLEHHTRLHTGEKHFKCDYCEKSFIRRCDLDRHLLTHTEERSFQCGGCMKHYTTRFHYTNHACQRDGWRNKSLKYIEYQPVSCNLALPICFPPEQTEPYDLTMGTNAAAAV